MAGKQLTTQNATITTASVEVKTLTISGKQVTLAVFRQLKEESLIATDGTLNGEPWGTVNYHPDKCGSDRSHWHVVWQAGGELRRSHVEKTADFDVVTLGGNRLASHWYSSNAANRYLAALVYMGLTAGGASILTAKTRRGGMYWPEATPDTYEAKLVLPEALAGTDLFEVQATAVETAVDAADQASRLGAAKGAAATELTESEKIRSAEWQATLIANRRRAVDETEAKRAASMDALRALIEEWGGFDAVEAAYIAEIKAEEARRRQHRATREAIAELPQLFIAV
ncbi:hypothetical protein ABZ341_36210 [Streptomyces sp. NPDC006173]|uniref:hypothetical protein n=1 Tax=Streptomyces sp. NPDC006173 TaxID=3155349 RepID=UPI0033DB6ADC